MKSASQPRELLLLESDRAHRRFINTYLSGHGFNVTMPGDQQELVALADRPQFGLALLDASLCNEHHPKYAHWAKSFCQRSDLGVILLSAEGDTRDSVRALNLGADDYVCKPFHEAELLARIRAVMRRYPANQDSTSTNTGTGTNISSSPAGSHSGNHSGGNQWSLNLAGRHILTPDGNRIRLTGRELDLLELLAKRPGKAVSRDHISMSLMGREWLPGDRSMDVLVRRLRSKLTPAGGREIIRTERHVGYSLSQVQVTH